MVEGPAGLDPLFHRVKLSRGVSILNNSGVYTAVRWPTQDELANATFYYLGGHEYVVDDATRTALIAAGIGVDSTNFDGYVPGGYGYGRYGSGPYGG